MRLIYCKYIKVLLHIHAEKFSIYFRVVNYIFFDHLNEFSDNDDGHLPENSKSSSYLEKRLGSNLNDNDTC